MIRTASFWSFVALAGGIVGSVTTGCSTAPKSDSARAALTTESNATVNAFLERDPSLRPLMNDAIGYAVFPNVGKAGFIGGGAYGRGEVFEHGMMVGYADIAQGSIGLQIGAQSYDELILFLTEPQLDRFKRNQFAFSANASAVALSEGAAAAADHSKGVIVLVRPQGGLMAEAAIGGQEFTFVPVGSTDLNNDRGYATGRE